MHFTNSIAVGILAFVPVIVAQQNMVTLGQAGNLMFIPNTMTVNQGDNVTFAFMSAAHSVASTSLAQPNVADNQVYSGIIPVDSSTPVPPGTNLPNKNNRLKIRATFPERDTITGWGEIEGRGLADLLAGKKNGGGNNGNANNNNNNAANANNNNNNNNANANTNNNNNNNNNGNTQSIQTQNAQNGNNLAGGVPTFTVQMNNVGMQAMICDQAQHAANGMIMMINVLPQGSQKRQTNSDQALQQALTQYLATGQNTPTTPATTNPGTGGQLNQVAQQLGPTNVNNQNTNNNNGNTNTNNGKKNGKKNGNNGNAGNNANANANTNNNNNNNNNANAGTGGGLAALLNGNN